LLLIFIYLKQKYFGVMGYGLFVAILKLEDEFPSNYRANKNKA